jgi:hypothetical protein
VLLQKVGDDTGPGADARSSGWLAAGSGTRMGGCSATSGGNPHRERLVFSCSKTRVCSPIFPSIGASCCVAGSSVGYPARLGKAMSRSPSAPVLVGLYKIDEIMIA